MTDAPASANGGQKTMKLIERIDIKDLTVDIYAHMDKYRAVICEKPKTRRCSDNYEQLGQLEGLDLEKLKAELPEAIRRFGNG